MNITRQHALALNIYNAMVDHKKNCNENCNVSILQLGEAALYILEETTYTKEVEELTRQIMAAKI